MGAAAAKDRLRLRIRAERVAESDELRAARGRRLADHAAAIDRLAAGSGVAAFQPTNGEPDIAELVARLGGAAAVLLPVVRPAGRLAWAELTPADLGGGPRRGIPTPAGPVRFEGAEVGAAVGVVLVPALAVDPSSGHRLGYGAGYYDRLLVDLPRRVQRVGVCRAADLMPVPVEPHDEALGWVLTEDGLHPVPPRPDPATA